MTNHYRIVQIGAGKFAQAYHAPTLQRLSQASNPRISLEAICDLDINRSQAFVRDFGYAKAYVNPDKMITEIKPDLIYCMVQPSATAALVEKLLPLGIPIFTEKPPGVTVTQAQRLATLAEEHKAISYVAFNRRRMPGLQQLTGWVKDNGKLRYVRAEMLRDKRLENDFGVTTAIHALDFLRCLCGNVKELQTLSIPHPNNPARDLIVKLTFEAGHTADLAVLINCGLKRESYLAHLNDTTMEVTIGTGYSSTFCAIGQKIYRNDQIVLNQLGEEDPLIAGGFLGEHEAFLDTVDKKQNPDCCLQDAYHSLKLGVAVHQGYSGSMADFKAQPPEC